MTFKIFDFVEIKLSKSYLRLLPKRHLNFIVAASLASNDMSVLSKILIGFSSKKNEPKQMAEIRGINYWTIRRILGAKIFESVKLIDRYEKTSRRSKNSQEIIFADQLKNQLEVWRAAKEYDFLRKVRDTSTNHYMFDDSHESLERFEKTNSFSMLMHSQSGNSYYPIGEEIAHLSFFDTDPSKGLDMMENERWFLDTAGEIIHASQSIFSFIFKQYPIGPANKITLYVDDGDIIQKGDRTPVLYFDPERSRI